MEPEIAVEHKVLVRAGCWRDPAQAADPDLVQLLPDARPADRRDLRVRGGGPGAAAGHPADQQGSSIRQVLGLDVKYELVQPQMIFTP